MFERIGYCFQALLNFNEKYNTKKVGRDRQWLIVWAKYVRDNCILAIANQIEGDWLQIYWNVMLLEAQHLVLDSYFIYLERKREQHAKFYEPRRELLMKHGIIQALQDLVDDKLDLLSISNHCFSVPHAGTQPGESQLRTLPVTRLSHVSSTFTNSGRRTMCPPCRDVPT